MVTAIKRSETVQVVLQQLRRDIVMGELKDKTPVKEVLFAEKYNCSRAALRGAIAVLAQEGLVKVHSNGTKHISALTVEDINHLYQLRTYIECTAVKQLLDKKTFELSKILSVLDQKGKDILETDLLFHSTLVELSENKALIQTWHLFIPIIQEIFYMNFAVSKEIKQTFTGRHEQLVHLIVNKDEKAVSTIEKHIEEARQISVLKN